MKKILIGLLLPLLFGGCLLIPQEQLTPPPQSSQESASQAFLEMGYQRLAEGDLPAAGDAFQAALIETPAGIWGAQAKLGLSQVEAGQNNLEGALDLAEQALLEPGLNKTIRMQASLQAFDLQATLKHDQAALGRGLALLDTPPLPLTNQQSLDILEKLLAITSRQNDGQTASILVNQVFKNSKDQDAAWLDRFSSLAVAVYPDHAPTLKSLWPRREGQLMAELIWVKYYLKTGPLSEAQAIIGALALTPDMPLPWQEIIAHTQDNIMQALEGGLSGRVGLIMPLTGNQAAYGKPLATAVEMGLGILSGEGGLTLFIEDDAGDPERAAMAVERLVNEHQVLAIIGPLGVKSTYAAAIKADEMKVPLISLSQSNTDLLEGHSYVFQNYFSAQDQVNALVDALIYNRAKYRVLVLAPNNNLGKNFAQIMGETLSEKGGELVSTRFYSTSTVDFYPIVQELAASTSFDALFIPDQAERSGAILNAIAEAHLNKIIMGTNLWHSGKLILTAGSTANGVLVPNAYDASVPQSRVAGDFAMEFKQASGRLPNVLDAQGFDAGLMLRQAIEDSPVPSRTSVAITLKAMQRFPGLCGMLSVQENGKIMKPLTIFTVNGGKFEPLFRSEDSF